MAKRRFGGDDSVTPLEVIAFEAAILAGEVKFTEGKCLVPGCDSGHPGHDFDGGAFIYCEKHNGVMHLDYDVDISGVPGIFR
jgi:hypothetical protein